MLFGSFAFTCRKDVEDARIIAVVNLDVLGRHFLDVVPNTVFVTGAEHYPELRQALRDSGTQAGMRVLPVGTDLAGPRGDHAAFESRPIPCLFFSIGLYRDYHKPSDTADKLDYAELERTAKVVLATTRKLGDGGLFQRSEATSDAEAEELQSVTAVMSEVITNGDRAGVKPEQAAAFRSLAMEAENCLQRGQYDRRRRAEFVIGAVGILAPSLLPLQEMGAGANQQKQMALYLQYLQQFYINHRSEVMAGYRQLVGHILKYQPGAFRGMPTWEYEVYDVGDHDIILTDQGDGRFALDVLLTPMTLKAEAKRSRALLESYSFGIFGSFDGIDSVGTREQLADLCLLRLREERTNVLHSENIKKVLKVVTGAAPNENYPQLLAQRLRRGGFKSEAEWISNCITSGVPELAREAIDSDVEDKDGLVRRTICQVIVDREIRADVRALAMEQAKPKADKDVLLALCAVLDDNGPTFTKDFWAALRPGYPFADRLEVKTMLPFLEKEATATASKTIADLALAQLRKTTHQDFGKDARRWQRWVELKVKVRSGTSL